MRNTFARPIVLAATLVVTAVALSACVTGGYDPYPRHGYNDRYDQRWDGRRDWNDRDGRRDWVDRDGDGRRDWWEQRR